jgi:hypothetical protein
VVCYVLAVHRSVCGWRIWITNGVFCRYDCWSFIKVIIVSLFGFLYELIKGCIGIRLVNRKSIRYTLIAISHFSRADTETGYELDGRGFIPGRGKRFSPIHSVQTGSEAHTASYVTGTQGSFMGIK